MLLLPAKGGLKFWARIVYIPVMPTPLFKRWEARYPIRSRLRDAKLFVKEPLPKDNGHDSEGEDQVRSGGDHGSESEAGPAGPSLTTEFLTYNTEILYEMFDCWGLRPRPTVKGIKKEALVSKTGMVKYVSLWGVYLLNHTVMDF